MSAVSVIPPRAEPLRDRPHHNSNPPLPPLELEGAHGLMRVASTTFEVLADRSPGLVDMTDDAVAFVEGSGINHGQLLVHSLHTTCGVIVNEHEPLLHEDIATHLERVAPASVSYRHDDFTVRTVNMNPNEQVNGHSHLKHLMLGSSETLPVIKGRLVLGRWQRLLAVELDDPRPRTIVLQLTGIQGH